MVKLRLMRMGKKKQPTYRIVAADSRSPRDGRFIEILGHYDPRQEPSVVNIESDKALVWLRKGAQPTETVRKLLEITGTWGEFKGGAPAGSTVSAAAPSGTTPEATGATTATAVIDEPSAPAPEAEAEAAPGDLADGTSPEPAVEESPEPEQAEGTPEDGS